MNGREPLEVELAIVAVIHRAELSLVRTIAEICSRFPQAGASGAGKRAQPALAGLH
jgi:hypothetical protein